VLQALERLRNAARQRKEERFTSLAHHINMAMLRVAFFALKRDAAPGVDGLTWQTYEADLDRNLTDLHSRVHRGAYRALPSRRQYHTEGGRPTAADRDCREETLPYPGAGRPTC
jgi:retron-type reverse transcriptase